MPNVQENYSHRTIATAHEALRKLHRALDKPVEPGDIQVVVEGADEIICLPRSVAELLREILVHTSAGKAVGVIPKSAELTTQQAADLLNVSRPHVIKLIDEGILEAHKVGTHRRLYASNVQEYKHQRDIEQRVAADELAALSDELGLYE